MLNQSRIFIFPFLLSVMFGIIFTLEHNISYKIIWVKVICSVSIFLHLIFCLHHSVGELQLICDIRVLRLQCMTSSVLCITIEIKRFRVYLTITPPNALDDIWHKWVDSYEYYSFDHIVLSQSFGILSLFSYVILKRACLCIKFSNITNRPWSQFAYSNLILYTSDFFHFFSALYTNTTV